jgi:hypothetical protein
MIFLTIGFTSTFFSSSPEQDASKVLAKNIPESIVFKFIVLLSILGLCSLSNLIN